MRQVVLDTETTGLEVDRQHRIIEIGCLELNRRRLTGRSFHRYVNPERDIERGALAVHGLTREQLAKEPTFAEIHVELLDFVSDAELIIHNAPFDIAFLNAELARLGGAPPITDRCTVLDTLALARQMHPGQRNSLDALCKRYSVDNSHRDYHGALLDARLLAEVYLAMTGGQAKLVLSEESAGARRKSRPETVDRGARAGVVVVAATKEEVAAHDRALERLDLASGGKTVWRNL